MNNTTTAVMTSGGQFEQAAQAYAAHGWHVLPVTGKRPHKRLAPRGYNSATTTPDVIRTWWRDDATANIGIACRQSGILVFDIDPRHGGDDALHELEQKAGPLPNTPRAITGGGGAHILFTNPKIRAKSEITAGVEIRDRAMIVASPSIHPCGRRYEWELPPDEIKLASVPPAWRQLLQENRHDITWRETAVIPAGRRNDTLTRVAGALRRAGVGVEGIEAALKIENVRRCRPPLPDNELRRIARSIGRRSIAPLWATDPLAFVNTTADLSPTQRLVLVALAHRANDQGKVIGGGWIPRETGLTSRAIVTATQQLETKGRIAVDRNSPRPNTYTLLAATSSSSLADRGVSLHNSGSLYERGSL